MQKGSGSGPIDGADQLAMERIRRIEIHDYDPAWPSMFQTARSALLWEFTGLRTEIHHVGSTSVPGLCAKPKIDIDVLMQTDVELSDGIRRLRATGRYHDHGERHKDGMWVFSTTTYRSKPGERIYLSLPDNDTHQKRILFRDHLRQRREVALQYGALKRRLAREAPMDWDFYTASKGPFVERIVQLASARAQYPSKSQ